MLESRVLWRNLSDNIDILEDLSRLLQESVDYLYIVFRKLYVKLAKSCVSFVQRQNIQYCRRSQYCK